ARKGRDVECTEAVMLQPADIAVKERAKIVHSIFEHRQPVDAAAESKALPLVGIEACARDHARVDHPGAQYFHPALLTADNAAAFLDRPSDVDFGRWLREREIARAHAEHDVLALEEGLEEGLQCPFEVPKGDALVDYQALDLVEHRGVSRVAVRAIHTPGRD